MLEKPFAITNLDMDEKLPPGGTRLWGHIFEVKKDLAVFQHDVQLFPDLQGFQVLISPMNAVAYRQMTEHTTLCQVWLHSPECEQHLGYDIWKLMEQGQSSSSTDITPIP